MAFLFSCASGAEQKVAGGGIRFFIFPLFDGSPSSLGGSGFWVWSPSLTVDASFGCFS